MTNENDDTLLSFPCEFPVKIVGLASDTFEVAVLSIMTTHFSDITEGAIKSRNSKGGKYLSLTIMVTAESQEQLDAMYRDLSAHDAVLMAL